MLESVQGSSIQGGEFRTLSLTTQTLEPVQGESHVRDLRYL